MRILLVEDNQTLADGLSAILRGTGHAVDVVNDGASADAAISAEAFDLVILDLTFPTGEDGMSLARGLRSQYDVPLIMLSGKSDTIDKVVCLELGADDYVTKPFEPRELLARIRTALRRTAGRARPDWAEATDEDGDACRFDGWRLDLGRRELTDPAGEPVRLTSQEFQLLAALASRPGRPLSRDQILDLIANRRWTPYDRSIDVLIGKLRRKLGDEPRGGRLIKTVRGVGYMFAPARG